MCTLAATKIDDAWFLIKTRDPVPWMRFDDEIKLFNSKADKFRKLIVQNPDQREDGYYGGINEKGVVFVATFLPVAENQISYIRRPYVRLILDTATAQDGIEIIKSFNPKIGGNFFIADVNDCFEVEASPDEYFIQRVDQPTAKTNHYLHLPYINLQMSNPWFAKWTENRLIRAQKLIESAASIEDLESILKDRENSDTSTAICMLDSDQGGNPPTYSAMIFNTGEKMAYYCQGNPLQNKFNKYYFE